MNVNDFTAPECPPTWSGILHQVFVRQTALMQKYKDIEQLPEPPLSLHTPAAQKVMKDFAWRVVEELAESYEGSLKHDDDDVALQHRNEEMADALHFMVELLIFAGVTPAQCLEVRPEYLADDSELMDADAWWNATYQLGIAMNFLRNKPWKQSQVPTDEKRFREQLLRAFTAFIALWTDLGIPMEELHSFYFRKSNVNEFRQRSQY